MTSKPCEAPRLVLFLTAGEVAGLYIILDMAYIQVDVSGGLTAGLFKLLAAYYVFDLAYPPVHSMFMGVIQTFVMEEAYTGMTSKGYKMLSRAMADELNDMPKENDLTVNE